MPIREVQKEPLICYLKLKGEEFVTEFPMPDFDRVDPNPAVKDITKATIAIVTSGGGAVPKGNPDHIESSSASKYGKYDIEGIEDLTSEMEKQLMVDMTLYMLMKT